MRALRLPSLAALALVVAVLLPLLSLRLLMQYGTPVVFLLPAAVFAVPVLGWRLLTNPVPVLVAFLFIVVNLDFIRLGEPGGVRITAEILATLGLLYALIVRVGLQKRPFWRTGVEKAYLLYALATFLSVLISVNIVFSFKNWIRDLEYLMILYFISGLGLTGKDRRRLVAAILLSSLIPCITALMGEVFKLSMFYGMESPVAGGEVARVQGTMGHPVVLGHYVAMLAILTLAMILDGSWYRRRLLVPLLSLQLLVLYLSYSRTGWVEVMVGIPVLLWIMGHRKRLLLGIPVVVVSVPLLLPTFLARWQTAVTADNNSFLWRIGLWIYALSKFPQRPIFGSGPDTFNGYIAYRTGFNAHNTWIQLLIEQGVVGVLAFAILMIVVARTLYRKLQESGPPRNPLVAATFTIWICFMVGAWAGLPFELPIVIVYFWVLTAMVVDMPVGREAAPVYLPPSEPTSG